jgi:hypothetical protein
MMSGWGLWIGRAPAVAIASGLVLGAPPVLAQSAAELRELIELQRQQLEEQARQLELMEERLRALEAEGEVVRETAEEAERVASEARERPTIVSGGTGIELALSGQINRMLTTGYDGDRTKLYQVDNANSSSRLRVVGSARPTEAVRVGTTFEFEMRSNPSTEVSQTNEDTGTANFRDRVIEIFAEHENFGRVSLGQGSTAYDGAAHVDLSGTTVIGYASVADLAGGLRFFDNDLDDLSPTTIGNVFNNFDGPRLDRLRYDTPTVAGFTLAADAATDQRWSTALRWSGKGSGLSLAAAVAYADPGGDRDWVTIGSGSLLHEVTGLSLTLAAGARDNDGRDDGSNYYAKLGWQGDVFAFGRSFTAVDVNRNDDVAAEGDEATSIGLFAVQTIRDWGIDLYGGYRWHELDRRDADFDDIHTFSLGSRVRF